MKLNSQKILIESFKENAWIAPLLTILNQFMGELVNGLNNNNITIEDNLKQELKDITFVNSSGNFPLRFTTKFAQLPKAVQIAYCLNKTDSVTESITTLPVWNYITNQIVINSITGLTSGKNYLIRVHVIYN